MSTLCFAGSSPRSGIASLIDVKIGEDDPRFDDHVAAMGTSFALEAHPSEEARDAALGPAGDHIEYVAVSLEEVKVMEPSPGFMAIGPSLYEQGFQTVADVVLPSLLRFYGEQLDQIAVTIARTSYVVSWPDGAHQPARVGWFPLYGPATETANRELEAETAMWLRGYLAGWTALAAA